MFVKFIFAVRDSVTTLAQGNAGSIAAAELTIKTLKTKSSIGVLDIITLQ